MNTRAKTTPRDREKSLSLGVFVCHRAFFLYANAIMNLSVGIVGLPNVGKSTLFNALTKKSVPAENYPFCTIDPSVGVVGVPDTRLETLAGISESKEVIPAAIEFVDIAGLVRGAAEGEGLGNQFLSHIREVDMIAEMVRIFDDADVTHVSGGVDPVADIGVINLELILKDTETVSKRLQSVERDAKRGEKEAVLEKDILSNLLIHLESGKLASLFEIEEAHEHIVKHLHLLSIKPLLYVLNKKAGAFNLDEQQDERWHELLKLFEETNAEYVIVDAGVEHELKDLHEEEKQEFRREYGSQNAGVDALIRGCYRRLGLISFFTTGEKETRAWTVQKDSPAPVAGAAIHTDFKDRFIRAQVVAYDDLVNAGSLAGAREGGKLRTEGKEYTVKDGDVIEFLI